MNYESKYYKRISSRSYLKFLFGVIPRFKKFLVTYIIVLIAKKNGAYIGKYVTIPYKLAKKANKNLTIGNNTVIHTHLIDLRAKVRIGHNVIIGNGVEIITCSHNIDSTEFEYKTYGIEIEDYCWLATRAFILPSCRRIGKGSVCAASSVVFQNIESMSVVSGNPATHLKYRKNVHSDLVVEAILGNDLIQYLKVYKYKK
jgi:acetyltransferase-like isoleucine patch superfamily enzyme